MSKNFRCIFTILAFLILILSIGTYTFFNFFKSNTKTDFQNSQNNSENNSQHSSQNTSENSQKPKPKNEKITLENLQAKENKFDN